MSGSWKLAFRLLREAENDRAAYERYKREALLYGLPVPPYYEWSDPEAYQNWQTLVPDLEAAKAQYGGQSSGEDDGDLPRSSGAEGERERAPNRAGYTNLPKHGGDTERTPDLGAQNKSGGHDVGLSQKQFKQNVEPSKVSDVWHDPERPGRAKGEKGLGVGTPMGEPLAPDDPRIGRARKGRGEGLPGSSIIDVQKYADGLWNSGAKGHADSICRRFKVPTPAERTQNNKESGNYGKPMVWSIDRVMKWRETSSEFNSPTSSDADFGGGNVVKGERPSGFAPGPAAGDMDVDAGELGPYTTKDLIKMGILKPKAASNASVPPEIAKRIPAYQGEFVRFHGKSKDVMRAFPNKATGNWSRTSGQTDPAKTGPGFWGGFFDEKGNPTKSGQYRWYTDDQFKELMRKNPTAKLSVMRDRARRQAKVQGGHEAAGDDALLKKAMSSPAIRDRIAAHFGLVVDKESQKLRPRGKNPMPSRAEVLDWIRSSGLPDVTPAEPRPRPDLKGSEEPEPESPEDSGEEEEGEEDAPQEESRDFAPSQTQRRLRRKYSGGDADV